MCLYNNDPKIFKRGECILPKYFLRSAFGFLVRRHILLKHIRVAKKRMKAEFDQTFLDI